MGKREREEERKERKRERERRKRKEHWSARTLSRASYACSLPQIHALVNTAIDNLFLHFNVTKPLIGLLYRSNSLSKQTIRNSEDVTLVNHSKLLLFCEKSNLIGYPTDILRCFLSDTTCCFGYFEPCLRVGGDSLFFDVLGEYTTEVSVLLCGRTAEKERGSCIISSCLAVPLKRSSPAIAAHSLTRPLARPRSTHQTLCILPDDGHIHLPGIGLYTPHRPNIRI